MTDYQERTRQQQQAAAAVDEEREAAMKALRIALKKKAPQGQVNVDEMTDEEVIEAAINAGLLHRDQLTDAYVEQHPEIAPDIANRPQGLDTAPADEAPVTDLFNAWYDANRAKEAGVELNGLDLATKAGHIRAGADGIERELAEEFVDHRQDVRDASKLSIDELKAKIRDETVKVHMGEHENPLDAKTIWEHKRASAIGKLSTEHGYEREDVEDMTLGELTELLATERAEAAATVRTAPGADGGSATDAEPVDGAEATTDADGPDTGAPIASDGGNTGQPGDLGIDDDVDDVERSVPSGDASTSGSVTIVDTINWGNDYHHGTDGQWYDAEGNHVTADWLVSFLDTSLANFDAYAMDGEIADPKIDSITPSGSSHEDALEERGEDSDLVDPPDPDADDDAADESDSDGDDSDDGSDDDDDDDDSNDDDDADDAEAADDDDEAEGETTESDAGNSESGTPNPMGADPIDPADQARFDDSALGRQQRQDQIDAIDAKGGHAGSPDDDPSDLDTAVFMASPVGGKMADTIADGIGGKNDGGDTDPADLDAVESDGPIIELKVSGNGLSDPVDVAVGGAAPEFGGGAKGNPLGGPPPVAGGSAAKFDTDTADGSASPARVELLENDQFDDVDVSRAVDLEADLEEFEADVEADIAEVDAT